MVPVITYCTAYPEDSSFEALHDAFSYRLTGSCTTNPEYDPGDMRKAILHALASFTYTTIPFLVLMALPAWEDTPWYSATIRSHVNLEKLIQIPAGHMRFVPAQKQTDGDTTSLPPEKMASRTGLHLKRGGQKQIRHHRPNQPDPCPCPTQRLPHDNRSTQFFPEHKGGGGRPYTPPAERPIRPFPVCPAAISPRTPPLGMPKSSRHPPKDTPSPHALASIPRYILPRIPIHLVEICGGMATILEAIFKAGHAVASYTWADIDPDARTTTSHRLARLHNRHPLLLPPEAMEGWDTRLPMDARTITTELFTKAFPERVDLIMNSPPMMPQHLPRTRRGQGQPAHAVVDQISYLIQHLAATQENGIEFVWDTLVGPPLLTYVLEIMGPSTVLNAPKCGSGAHRPTRIWQNLLPKEELDEAYSNLKDPPHTGNGILEHAGLGSWHMPTRDTTSSTAIPTTFLLRFRTRPPPGGIGPNNNYTTPRKRRNPHTALPEVWEILMGFTNGDTKAMGLTPATTQ